MIHLDDGLLRSLCFFDACDYAPTIVELKNHADVGAIPHPNPLVTRGGGWGEEFSVIETKRGRCAFPGRSHLIDEHERRSLFFPRKLRRARAVARWLSRMRGVRFVALCNTMAWMHADDEADLDFFVVTRAGHLWQSRGLGLFPFKLFRQRPGQRAQDPVCLSFWVDDTSLDLSSLQIDEDDVYFRQWFLSLFPLYDDGVSMDLWKANFVIRRRHPQASQWIMNREARSKKFVARIPTFGFLDSLAKKAQRRFFPASITSRLNQNTTVVATDHVLKFHVDDRRAEIRDRYRQNCLKYGIHA